MLRKFDCFFPKQQASKREENASEQNMLTKTSAKEKSATFLHTISVAAETHIHTHMLDKVRREESIVSTSAQNIN